MRSTSERKRDLAPKLRLERLETRITLSAAPLGPELWLAMAPHVAESSVGTAVSAMTMPAAVSTPKVETAAPANAPFNYAAPIAPIVFARSIDWLSGIAPRSESQPFTSLESTALPTASIAFTPLRPTITVSAGSTDTQAPGAWNVERFYTKLETLPVGMLIAPTRSLSLNTTEREGFTLVNSVASNAQNVAFNVAKFDFARALPLDAQPVSTLLVSHFGDFKLGEWSGTLAGRPTSISSGRVEILEGSVIHHVPEEIEVPRVQIGSLGAFLASQRSMAMPGNTSAALAGQQATMLEDAPGNVGSASNYSAVWQVTSPLFANASYVGGGALDVWLGMASDILWPAPEGSATATVQAGKSGGAAAGRSDADADGGLFNVMDMAGTYQLVDSLLSGAAVSNPARLLAAIPCELEVVDQALAAVMSELDRVGDGVVGWLDELHWTSSIALASLVAGAGAGVWYVSQGYRRRAAAADHDDDSLAWLFQRLHSSAI